MSISIFFKLLKEDIDLGHNVTRIIFEKPENPGGAIGASLPTKGFQKKKKEK